MSITHYSQQAKKRKFKHCLFYIFVLFPLFVSLSKKKKKTCGVGQD